MIKGPAEPNGRKAAVIGAGPAGLTITIILARKGYRITIFDSRDKIGGVLRFVICVNLTGTLTASQYESSYAKLEGVDFIYNKCTMEIREFIAFVRDA